MRRLLVAVVVLLALLLVGDRVGAAVAASAVATQVQSATASPSQPEVEIGGFPFLTQAVAGRYDEVVVVARDVPARDLTVARLEATLSGVQVPLSEALSGSVQRVPVESVAARALVTFDELAARFADRQLTLAADGDRVRVTSEIRGQSITAVSRVEVVDGALVVTGESFEADGAPVEGVLARALGARLDVRLPVAGLPYGLQVTDVEVQPEGLGVLARAGATVLSPV